MVNEKNILIYLSLKKETMDCILRERKKSYLRKSSYYTLVCQSSVGRVEGNKSSVSKKHLYGTKA